MSISILEAKKKADRLHGRMNELGFKATHAQALEVLACAFGDSSWAAMRARLNVHASARNLCDSNLAIYQCAIEGAAGAHASVLFVLAESPDAAKRYAQALFDVDAAHLEVQWDGNIDASRSPAMSEVAQWVRKGLLNRKVSAERFVSFLKGQGIESVNDGSDVLSLYALRHSLRLLFGKVGQPQAVFASLYAGMPELGLFFTDSQDACYCEELGPKNEADEALSIYTMVVNPVFGDGSKYRHDLRVHVLASSLAEAQQRVTEYGAAHGLTLKGVIAMENKHPLNRQTMPDLACFSRDLAAQLEKSDALREAFEEFIYDNVRSMAAKKTGAYTRDEVAALLNKATQEFSGPDSFFQVLTTVLNRSGAYRGYVSRGDFGFFSKSQIQGIRWATA